MSHISFSFVETAIWNFPPQHIRSSDSLSAFRGLLKTFLYQKSLPPYLSIVCTKCPRISTYSLKIDSPLFHAYSISNYFCRIPWIARKRRPDVICKKRTLNSLVLLPDVVTLNIIPKKVATAARACDQKPCPLPPIFKTVSIYACHAPRVCCKNMRRICN